MVVDRYIFRNFKKTEKIFRILWTENIMLVEPTFHG